MLNVLQSLIQNWPDCKPRAILEIANARPRQRGQSKFVHNYGLWEMALVALKISHLKKSPSVWMKHYGTMPSDYTLRLAHLRKLCQQRWPEIKVTNKTAAAMLIAEWGRAVGWQ